MRDREVVWFVAAPGVGAVGQQPCEDERHNQNEASAQPSVGDHHTGTTGAQAAAVLLRARTCSNTATALFISSIVPNDSRQCVFSNGGKSRATSTPFARHASRNAFAGRPMFTNMKFACASVGFIPRSANHFIVKSRTSLLRARSLAVKDPSCWIAAMPAWSARTLSEPVPDPPSHSAIF